MIERRLMIWNALKIVSSILYILLLLKVGFEFYVGTTVGIWAVFNFILYTVLYGILITGSILFIQSKPEKSNKKKR